MRFFMTANNVACGAVADTYTTLAALIAAATTGYKARLLRLNVGPSDDSPADANISVKVARIDDVSAGGAGTKTGVAAADMGRPFSDQRDGIITGGHTYTVEPTVYGDPVFQMDFNVRGGFFHEWDLADAPIIDNDQLLGILVAPRAASAATVSMTLEFEEF